MPYYSTIPGSTASEKLHKCSVRDLQIPIGPSGFGNPFWVRGYKKHNTPAGVQAETHGIKRAGVVCFSLDPKRDF